MNGILLDTSAYSAMARGNKGVLDAVQTAENVCVNPIIVGELLAGFAQGNRESYNIDVLERFLESPRCMILPLGKESAKRYAHIQNALRMAGAPVPTDDLWIAATAMEYGLEVVTLDKHFAKITQIVCRLCNA